MPSCAHTIPNGDKGNTTPILLYSHKATAIWLVQALISEQRYTHPTKTYSLSDYNTWSITNFIR
jgi:hypothetical protein